MFMARLLSWWYKNGWKQVALSFSPRLKNISNFFSVNQLTGTLFAPWRRIITYPGASIGERFRAFGDNLFSRSIGFVIRLLVLIAALVCSVVVMFATAVELILWPFVPPAIIGLIVLGVVR
ncbi:MAG TPA: hypothetical protein VL989_00670 [Candidatus Sulfotelmatobacter sp.]|nr:hypothetical protein [Candidatus Sulfotelmatobacter sp.]